MHLDLQHSAFMLAGEHEELRPCPGQHPAWLGSHMSWPRCFPCVPYGASVSNKDKPPGAGQEGSQLRHHIARVPVNSFQQG